MRDLLKAEIKKITKSFPLKLTVLAMLVFALVTALSNLSYKDSPLQVELGLALSGYDAFLMSLRDSPLLIVLGIIAVGILICGDFDNRTIQAEIYAGHSRTSIVVSKYIAVLIGYTVMLIPYPFGRLIFQSMFYGFGHPVDFSTIQKMLSAFMISILIGMAITSIGILIAFTIRKTVVAVGGSILLLLFGGNALLSFGPSFPSFGALLNRTPFGLSKSLWVSEYAAIDMWIAFAICLFTIVSLCVMTSAVFRTAELK